MNSTTARVAASLLALAVATPASAAMTAGVPGSFVFTPAGHFADKPIAVYYYRPKSAGPHAELLFAMHGADRSGKKARDNWRGLADKRGFIVVSPEFDQDHYPNDAYQLAGFDEKNPADRTPAIIEQLFDRLKAEEGLDTPAYKMFGHSAGAQFGHRLLLQGDSARASIVVAANAGTYTMPIYPARNAGLRFPMVLARDAFPPDALARAFGRRLVILLGGDDTDMSGKDVPTGRAAEAQGANRLERGKKFCLLSERAAIDLQARYNWTCAIVPGVAHDSRNMARAAIDLLFPEPK